MFRYFLNGSVVILLFVVLLLFRNSETVKSVKGVKLVNKIYRYEISPSQILTQITPIKNINVIKLIQSHAIKSG